MDTIRDGSTDGDGQDERPESGVERITEDPASNATRVEAGNDTANPGVDGESGEGGPQLEESKKELRRAYWREWYAKKGGREKVAASRAKKNGQVTEN